MTLPKGWSETTMGELCEVVAGSTPKTSVPEYWDGDIPWITPDDLSRHRAKYIDRGARSLTQAGYDSCSTRLVPEGSILYTTRAPIGYAAVAERPVCTNQGFKNFVPPSTVDSSYLYWYLRYATPMIRGMGSGTTFREVSKKVAQSIPVVLPLTKIEQRRIVEAIEEQFSRLDAAEEYLQSASARLHRLETAALVLPKGEWPEVPFGDVTENHDGRRIPVKKADREIRAGAYPYYGAQGVIDTIDDYLFDGDYLLVAEDGANLLSRVKPLALRASGRFWVNNHAHVVTPKAGVTMEYLEMAVNSLDVRRSVTGSAQPKLTQANLNRLTIPVPPVGVQADLASRWSNLGTSVQRLEDDLQAARRRLGSLRTSVLRDAFAGRLVPQETLPDLGEKVGA